MARGKARFNRQLTLAERISGNLSQAPDLFSPESRLAIQAFYPANKKRSRRHRRGKLQFCSEIIGEARWAADETENLRLRLKKKDLVAEIDMVLRTTQLTKKVLSKLSDDLDVQLGPNVQPLEIADALALLIARLKQVARSVDNLPQTKLKDTERKHAIAVEAAVRVLRVAKSYGMTISATGEAGSASSFSDAIKLMRQVGEIIGLSYEASTWRNLVADAKRITPDLNI